MRPTLVEVGSGASTRPAFRTLVRERISNLLEGASAYPVVLLLASAGYGKTVALGHWLENQRDVRFYRVREGTFGPFDFAAGLAKALDLSSRSTSAAINAAHRSDRADQQLASWFENQLRNRKGAVVIDDFHVAAAGDPQVSSLIASLIERTPHLRWIIASRSACDLPVTSWIAYGKSQRPIIERDLVFESEEARAAAELAGVNLSSAQLDSLYYLTGGWPIALTLALTTLEFAADTAQWSGLTRELSYDFLSEQVYNRLPPEDRTFLLRTSVFDSFDAPVLTRAGYAEAHHRVEQLRKNGSFIVQGGDAIRYHDLFREFLHRQLERQSELFESSWRTAAEVYEALGDLELATAAYQRIADAVSVGRLLGKNGFELAERNRPLAERLIAWLHERRFATDDARVVALEAKLRALSGELDRAQILYQEAIAKTADPALHAEIVLEYGHDLSQQAQSQAIELLESIDPGMLSAPLQARLYGELSAAYALHGELEAALGTSRQAQSCAGNIHDQALEATILHQCAIVSYYAENWGESAALEERALQLANKTGYANLISRIHSLLQLLASGRDDANQSLWHLKQMERAARECGDGVLTFSAVMAMYEFETERGNDAAIERVAHRLREFDATNFSRSTIALLPSFAMQAAWRRKFSEAYNFVRGSAEGQASPPRRALRFSEVAFYAACAGVRRDAELALAAAQANLREGLQGETNLWKRRIRTGVMMALAYIVLGQLPTAHRIISGAERRQEKFSARYKALLAAVRAMHVHAETRAFHGELEQRVHALEGFGLGGYARLLNALPLPQIDESSASVAILTATEIDVLRAIDRFGTSKAVAAALGNTQNTIDWHVKRIVKKLEVKNRRAALELARERGWLR